MGVGSENLSIVLTSLNLLVQLKVDLMQPCSLYLKLKAFTVPCHLERVLYSSLKRMDLRVRTVRFVKVWFCGDEWAKMTRD